jgi:glycosyltransferase involved in cell wall biosynthesis
LDSNLPPALPKANIVVVGPIAPFRGGIAQYNSLLLEACNTLALRARFFSFKRQYPRWLYPGKSDRDPDLDGGHTEPGVRYTIDSVNPITWWRTAREIVGLEPDLVVFHWWTWFWAPCFLSMVWILRLRGTRIGMICHNLVDHDTRGIGAWISRRIIGMADVYLVHSSEHAENLAMEWPDKAVAMHPIPVFGNYPAASGTLRKRGRIELLFFGFIRPYKGLDVLLDALELLKDEEIHLTVIGEYWGDPGELIRRTEGYPGIQLHLGYMANAEAAEYFDRADFVMLPYTSATPSAVAAVAYHYDTPIIASRVAGIMDVVLDGQTGILFPANNPGALAEILRTVTRARSVELSAGIAQFKQRVNWESLCRALAGLANQATARARGR